MEDREYIEFLISDPQRFTPLEQVFSRLKSDKEQDQIKDEEDYLPYFDEAARSYFWWPTERECQSWLERWYATPVATRWEDPSLEKPWSFGSMIEGFRHGEYRLLSCAMTGPTLGRLRFYSLAHPYGGTGCMQALVECFGFRVTAVADGAGPIQKF